MTTEEMTSQMGEETAHRLRDLQGRIGEQAKQISRATDEYVHENPWRTVALAALVGCLVGFLMRPRGD